MALPVRTKAPAGLENVTPLKAVPLTNEFVFDSPFVPVKINDSPPDNGVDQLAPDVHRVSAPLPLQVEVAAFAALEKIVRDRTTARDVSAVSNTWNFFMGCGCGLGVTRILGCACATTNYI